MRKVRFLGVGTAAAAALVVAATALATESTQRSAKMAAARISTRKLPRLGTVLVNSKGRTLYMFVPDKRKKVTCVRACAAVWPPAKLPAGAKPVAAGHAKASLLGSDPNPAGGRASPTTSGRSTPTSPTQPRARPRVKRSISTAASGTCSVRPAT